MAEDRSEDPRGDADQPTGDGSPIDPALVDHCITQMLSGDGAGSETLLPIVYGELRRLAGGLLAGRAEHTLQPTALVHEAWMRLARRADDFEGRSHFFGVAAKAMRQILVNHARDGKAQKRGGDAAQVTLSDTMGATPGGALDVLEIHDALERLHELHERQARIVELRLFAGLSVEEVAAVLGVSDSTVKNDWRFARVWLKRELQD